MSKWTGFSNNKWCGREMEHTIKYGNALLEGPNPRLNWTRWAKTEARLVQGGYGMKAR